MTLSMPLFSIPATILKTNDSFCDDFDGYGDDRLEMDGISLERSAMDYKVNWPHPMISKKARDVAIRKIFTLLRSAFVRLQSQKRVLSFFRSKRCTTIVNVGKKFSCWFQSTMSVEALRLL